MTESGQEFSGKTVEEAIADGLSALGLSQNDVEIDIINKGSRGILGFGSEPALVRLTPHSVGAESSEDAEPETLELAVEAETEVEVVTDTIITDETVQSNAVEPTQSVTVIEEAVTEEGVTEEGVAEEGVAEEGVTEEAVAEEAVAEEAADDDSDEIDDEALAAMASDLLAQLIRLMDFEAEIDASWQGPDETTGSPYLLLDIRGDNLGALIGRRGETLSSIQYLLRLMVNQQVRQWKNIVVDVEQYKERRVAQLSQLAERMARQVAETGRSVTLEPMPGNERRIIHMTLRDNPDVFTESTGEGERRKVNIFPQR